MKQLLLASLIIACGSALATNTASPTKSALLREDYQQTYTQLDELTGTLEYIGQVVNKGAIKGPIKKREVRLWLLKQLGEVKTMRDTNGLANEQTLVELLRTMNSFISYLAHAIDRNFEELEDFEGPHSESQVPADLTPEQAEVIYGTIGQLLQNNQRLFKQIQNKINTLGFTKTNIWVRWLDNINTKYSITSKLESMPRMIALSAAAIYLTPYDYFYTDKLPGLGSANNDGLKEIPGLHWLKRQLGTLKFWDPKGHTAIGWYNREDEMPDSVKNPPVEPKPNGTLADLLKSSEKKLFLGLLAGTSYLLLNDPVKEYIEPIKKRFTPVWNKLKGFNIQRIGTYKHPDITLEDPRLVGLDSQVGQMKNIVRYITDPETFDRSASGLEKGILLTGPSRSGKTLIANALCGSINENMHKKGMIKKFAFKQIKWSDVRWSTDGIKSILEEAKRNAPCVLFLDEVHNLPLQVKEGGEVLSQFLTMGDSLQSTGIGDAIIIIAATNRSYALDDALLKPGRFGLQIHFERPTRELRKKYFATMYEYNAISVEGFDLDQLARLTEHCSYGDLDMIFKSTRFMARHEKRSIQQEDFLHTIYEQVYRIRFDHELPLSETAHKLVAAHQAGHALLYMYYDNELQEQLEMVTTRGQWAKIEEKRFITDDLHKAHEEKKTTYGHLFTSKNSEMVDLGSSPELKAKMLLAGAVAEEVLLGSSARSYHQDDTRKALQVLEDHVFRGLSAEDFTKDEIKEPKKEAKRLLKQCEKEVKQLLIHEKEGLKRLSEALQKQLLLSYTEVKGLLEITKK